MTQYFYNSISLIGRSLVNTATSIPDRIQKLGAFGHFILYTLKEVHPIRLRFDLVMRHMRAMGVDSFFIIALTGIFTGMVLALQTGRAFELFQAETLTGAVSALSITKELGPVLTGLMFTARVGSSMGAQLGTMRVTEQIDALTAMAVNPVDYLVLPRVIAAMLVLPLLTAMFDFIGIAGSYLVGVHLLNIDHATFMERIVFYMEVPYIVEGLFKSAVFGFIIAFVSCYKGYFATGGAEGVGRVTTQAVVVSSVSILIVDYFLTAILF
jgi:phospholipid/cholesterol/gamma-HCH transport system permease protein